MRKEIPLFITALVGVILIFQYFSPLKQVNSVEKMFMNWMQIIAAFSIILGVLNLIRVNGDKIYKKRKSWGFSAVIIIALFGTMITGFANIGGETMYDRNVLKTNTLLIENVSAQVLKESKIEEGSEYNALLLALVTGTQKEKVVSSILPEKFKNLEAKYTKMLKRVKKLSYDGIKFGNQTGRDLSTEVKNTIKKLNSKSFKSSILGVYDDVDTKIVKVFNTKFKLSPKDTILENIKSQFSYVLLSNNTDDLVNSDFTYYANTRKTISELNDFFINDENLLALIQENIKSSKSYNEFYQKMLPSIKLKKENTFADLIVKNVLTIYFNEIYRFEANITKDSLKTLLTDGKINKKLSENETLITSLSSFVKSDLNAKYDNMFSKFVTNNKDYVSNNKLLTTNVLQIIVYKNMIKGIFDIKKANINKSIEKYLASPIEIKKLIVSKIIIKDVASLQAPKLEKMGYEKSNANFVLVTLLSTGKYKLSTLDNGSSFMEIYRYLFSPLQATMFALLAFFVASASYRAFRARNKEATLLLVAGFIVMLGRVPVGEIFSIEGVFNISKISQFIMAVPAMSVQSGIMIGVALGVISTSLRLILGIERSHLGGD